MSSDNKNNFLSPNLLSLLLILLGGGLFISQSPFHSPRPDRNQLSAKPNSAVLARLWQDPFEAVAKQRGTNPGNESDIVKGELAKLTGQSIHTLYVLAVMMPSGEYAEDSEARRRIRYSVMSGLMVGENNHYAPLDSEHLQFVDYATSSGTNTVVVFETMAAITDARQTSSPSAPVLVLYVNNDDIEFADLQSLAAGLHASACCQETKFSVLGPATSDTLQKFAEQIQGKETKPFKLYSPRATVDENLIEENLHAHFKQHGLDFIRTTATDAQLADGLAAELALRGVTIGWPQNTDMKRFVEPTKHVVLISEKESLYARHIGTTFAEALQEKAKTLQEKAKTDALTPPSTKEFIRQYHYIRGLDGKLAKQGTTAQTDEKSNSTGSEHGDKSSVPLEHAFGNSQFDYMRRLAEAIADYSDELDDQNAVIGAIGVLGSDVYDKLLVLEALHEKFPSAWFFTNNMDARLLHPEENQWARNLIVVSSYGLSLPDSLQDGIPPFRDSIQSGYFLSTQQALWEFTLPSTVNQAILDKQLFNHSVLYEIGRNKAFLLPAGNSNSINSNSTKNPSPLDKMLKATQTAPSSNTPVRLKMLIGTIFLAMFIVCWLYFKLQLDIARSEHLPEQKDLVLWQFAWITTALTFAGVAWWICFPFNLEPVAWIEGVSMWPSTAIRILALMLAVHWIVELVRFPALFWERINYQGKFIDAAGYHNVLDDKLDNRLRKMLHWRRIAMMTFLGFIFAFAIIFGFGQMFTPYRGPLMFWLDFISLKLLLVPAFLFLMFGVTECARAVTQFIRYAPRDLPVVWIRPQYLLEKYCRELNIPCAYLSDWVTIRVVAEMIQQVSRLISYPLYIAALMIVARMSYFDNWNNPPGLMIIIVLSLGYLFYCDYRLKNVADKAEKNAIKNLSRMVIKQSRGDDEGIVDQLEKLSELAKHYAEDNYKPFLQRPFFQGLLVIFIATAVGYTDYLSIMIKLLGSH